MRLILYFTGFILMAVALAGCQATQENRTQSAVNKAVPTATTQGDGVRRITPTELRALLEKGEVVVVDVRNEASFYAGHIPNAKLIPNTAILSHLQELPRDRLIVTYCS